MHPSLSRLLRCLVSILAAVVFCLLGGLGWHLTGVRVGLSYSSSWLSFLCELFLIDLCSFDLAEILPQVP